MAKIVGKPKYWAEKKYPGGQPFPKGMTQVFIKDKEAWTNILVTDEFVEDAVGMPALLFQMLNEKLVRFKETSAQVCWPIEGEQ